MFKMLEDFGDVQDKEKLIKGLINFQLQGMNIGGRNVVGVLSPATEGAEAAGKAIPREKLRKGHLKKTLLWQMKFYHVVIHHLGIRIS